MNILFCFSLILLAATASQAQTEVKNQCPQSAKLIDDSAPVSCENCELKDHCCKKEDECYLMDVPMSTERTMPSMHAPQFQTPHFGQVSMHAMYPGNPYAQHSLLNMCAAKTFPYVCQQKQMYDYTYKCQVNIPYCQRIPCSPGENGLDVNIHKCMSIPGCCYDQPLAYYRRTWGENILPGVPVCHLAIRNKYFQKEALEHVSKYKSWNPLMTSCLIDSYKDYIYMNKKSCDGVKALEYFGFKAKKAGWTGITSQECFLIGGCWRQNVGCHYEPRITKLRIRSAQEIKLPKKWTPQQIFGQPKCLDLDYNMGAQDFLTSLHYCVASGCQLDASISTRIIQHYMMNITQNLPSHMANLFRHEWNAGIIGVDNYQQQINHYHRHPELITQQNHYTNNYLQNMANPYYKNIYSMPHQYSAGGFTPYLHPYNSQYHQAAYRSLGGDEDDSGRTFNWQEHPDVPRHPHYPLPTNYGYGNLGSAIYGQYNSYYNHFYCPFRRPTQIRGFPVLEGRFDGCCDRPLCYMNRETVAEQTSGAASYYRPWSTWGPCSASCGEGVQYRRRTCVGVTKCVGKDEESQKCTGYYQCHGGKWLNWSKWSRCSAKRCGDRGTITRTRKCQTGYRCTGPAYQTKNCGGCRKP